MLTKNFFFSQFDFQVLCVNYCSRVKGASLKILLQRCRNLKCLLMQQTSLDSENVMAAEWEKAEQLQVIYFSINSRGNKVHQLKKYFRSLTSLPPT